MYAFSADTSTIRQKETRKVECHLEQHLRTSLKVGYARLAEWGWNISKRNAEFGLYQETERRLRTNKPYFVLGRPKNKHLSTK